MKITILILFIIFQCNHFTVSQWMQQVSPVTDQGMLDCDFINQNTGWACGGGGVILKTTNGGVNWVQQATGVSQILFGIEAIDANLLWCVGQSNTKLKSSNGGTNWQLISGSGPSSFQKAFFLNANTGWMIKNHYILRTTNGGNTFDSSYTTLNIIEDIYFKDALTGLLCGGDGVIMRSIDGGIVWNQISIPPPPGGSPSFQKFSFVGDYGWTVLSGFFSIKSVYRTTNFGMSWDVIGTVPYSSSEETSGSVFFSSLSTGYCGGSSGHTFKTTNGGLDWYQQTVPSHGYRNDFWFANDSLGWSVGDYWQGGEQIFKTTNGGTFVSIVPISNSTPDAFKLCQNYPNPFNPITKIKFDIPKSESVKLAIYNILGKEMEILVNEELHTGEYEADWNASNYPGGVYYYKLITLGYSESKKMVLVK